MKTPICGICLKSDVFCKVCNDKVKSGEVSELDIRVARIIFELSGKLKSLKDISIVKIVETRSMFVLVCEEGDASKMVGRSGIIVKKLGRELGKRVKIVEKSDDDREFMEKLVFPAKITGINVLYAPGKETLKVKLDKSSPISPKDFKEIMKELFDKDVEL